MSKKERLLMSRPVRNEAVSVRTVDNDELEITIYRKKTKSVVLLSKLFRLPVTRKIILDKIGACVWTLCDGNKTVNDIIKVFSKKYSLSREKAERSLLMYLRQLTYRGLIAIAVPK
ncbi:PqqD family protein [bacterium]|nr:PqqD family protein [bacterium]